MRSSTSLFDNYNARHSTYEEIAESFISNDDFYALSKFTHTFVLGPRGCGKTTMFRMLSPIALNYWSPSNSDDLFLKNNFQFIGIYIPSDELWKDQLKKLLYNVDKDEDLTGFISNALVTLNILANFCSSIKMYINIIEPEKSIDKEYSFCLKLLNHWGLENCVASLVDIQMALISKKSALLNKLKSYILRKKFGDVPIPEFDESYHGEFLDYIKNAILAFEDVYLGGRSIKWALCFDELELVSQEFTEIITKKLRIAPPNIVFKLSSGPLTKFYDNIAQVFHDYEIIKMWPFSHKEEPKYMAFCEAIANQRIQQYIKVNELSKSDMKLHEFLGVTDYVASLKKEFHFEIDEKAKEYEKYSVTWYAFRELARLDHKFCEFLKSKVVDVDNPVPKSVLYESSFFRKYKEIVVNRLIFNKYKDGHYSEQKTLKEYSVYYGYDTILRISEGNPRFIINIMSDLLANQEDKSKMHPCAPEVQYQVIKNVSARFEAMLMTYPTSKRFHTESIDLKWLIQKLGGYFEEQVNRKDFPLNPATSFTYSKDKTRPGIINLLQIGVSLGAIIRIDNTKDNIIVDNNTRFRLTYLLHPEYKLPLRLYSNSRLHKILPPRYFYRQSSSKNRVISQTKKLFDKDED